MITDSTVGLVLKELYSKPNPFKVGDKVSYFSKKDSTYEHGIVKEIPTHTDTEVRVVYHCGGMWDDYTLYTSQLTPINNLKLGWI